MSFWSWLKGAAGTLGMGAPEAMAMLEGSTPGSKVRAHWKICPLSVYVDGDNVLMDRAWNAVAWWNGTIGVKVMHYPEFPLLQVVEAMNNPKRRPLMGGVILVRGGGDDPSHGHTDMHWNRHTGELLSATVTLPAKPVTVSIDRHELGHALGLAHVPSYNAAYSGTLMERFMAESDALQPAWYQVKALKGMGGR